MYLLLSHFINGEMWLLIWIVGSANEWDAATITSDFCHRVGLLQCSQGDMTPYVRIHMHYRFVCSVVAVAFQIAFRAKIHANNIFLFFKNHF
jgi:hypothetical protein